MAERTTIARPYADAAFQIARDENALARWSEMMKLARAVGEDPQMADALTSPRLDGSEKASLFLGVAGDRFSAPMRNFVRILIEADRVELLPEIAALFETMRNEAEGVAQATIESALPMSETQVADITAALAKRFGKRIEASTSINPALIGGARIAVGDTVIDGSVREKLEQMKHSLLR
jgi:F-type H+-transporting ATPase subunit delta